MSIFNDATLPIIKEISFAEISLFWATHLWQGRKSEIEPVSCINSDGQIDLALKIYIPNFFGVFENDILIGAVSTCQTSADEFRFRGICILPKFRKNGLSRRLFFTCINHILQTHANPIIWTLARETNHQYYSKYEFKEHKRVSDFEFGPHIILKNDNPRDTLVKMANPNFNS